MNLKDRALAAHKEDEERIQNERLEKRRRVAAQTKTRLIELFGNDDYEEHDDGTVTVGDLVFGMSYEFNKYVGVLCLVGKCIGCTANVNLGTIACLETLGRTIAYTVERLPMCEECNDVGIPMGVSVQRNTLYTP